MIKKVLLIGGSSDIGKSLIDSCPYSIYSPPRKKIDLSDRSQIENIDVGMYDVLILNAGVGMSDPSPFAENSSEKIHNIFTVNTIANFIMIKNYLSNRSSGTVVYVSSRASNVLNPSNIAYASSKLAVKVLLESIRDEYKNFKLLIASPGKVKARHNRTDSNYQNYVEPRDLAEKIWHAIENNIEYFECNERKE